MKRIISLGVILALSMNTWATVVNYTADNTSIFPNPERGFIIMLTGHLTTSDPYAVKGEDSELNKLANTDKGTLVLVHYYLDSYKTNGTIPSKILNAFDEDMQELRSRGMKAIIRFSYVNKVSNETAADADWSIVQQHINQYKSHWQANADVIVCFQAGIVGAWGEWYYTSHYGNKVDYMTTARKQVVDALLEAVPSDRCIQLRTPKFKTTYPGCSTPLTALEAYQNTPKARLGHHNDAFLYGPDNMGTYEDTATQKPYLAQETLYVPIGGETDIDTDAQADTDASHDATVAEMSRMHWTFIQGGFSEVVTDKWRANGTFDELNRNMGYRYQLTTATLPSAADAGSSVSVKLNIKNVGYAPLYNERHAYIVLKNGTKTYPIQLASDPRRWLPNGVVTTIDENITIPTNVPAGTYQMYLYMPDKYASLASNPKYAVRFANSNVWESTTGMNKLNASIVISEGTTPPPTPSAFTIDGNFDDWADLTNLAHTEVPSDAANKGLYDMRWYADESDVFFYLEYAASTNTIDIMLSTDENSSTGNDYWQWTNAGAEFLIEGEPTDFTNATFYVFDNTYPQTEWNGWIETSVSNLLMASEVKTLSNGHNAIEGRISQANLGTISTLRVGTYICENWNPTGRLPQGDGGAAVPMLEVPIQKATATILPVVTPAPAARKILHNGQLFIIRDGQIYTLQGQRLP